MRAHEFITEAILREYRRDVTAQALGDRLIMALAYALVSYLPDSLYNAHTLADMALYPDRYVNSKPMRLDILGQPIASLRSDNAKEVLAQLKPQIINAVLAEIESHDPTPNKEYSQWLARAWTNSKGSTKFEDLNRNDLLSAYTLGKRRRLIKPEHADINKFKTWQEFEKAIIDNYNVESFYGSEDQDPRRGDAKTVYEDDRVRVIVPNDETAACYYGQGTRWCTASTRGHNYFNQYNKEGKLYILLPKKPTYEGEKYQLHFPSGQFMDESDTPVNVYSLLADGYPGLLAYLKKNEPTTGELIVFADDETLTPIIKKIGEFAQEYIWEIISEWESNDDYYQQWQSEQAIERGYVDEEGDVDWDRVHNDSDLNNYLEFNDEARYYERDVMRAFESTTEQVREAAAQMQEEEGSDPAIIRETDDVMAYMVASELGSGDSTDIVEWLRRGIRIQNDAPREPGAKPIWTVSLIRGKGRL